MNRINALLISCIIMAFPIVVKGQYFVELASKKGASESANKIDSTLSLSYMSSFPEHNLIMRQETANNQDGWGGKWLKPLRTNSGAAFIGSLVVPGLTQAANEKWARTAVYVVVEVAAFVAHQYYLNEGRAGEKSYINYVNDNWSVVKYAEFLVDYHASNNSGVNVTMQDLINPGANYTPGQYNYGKGDWGTINIDALRELEKVTLYDFYSSNSNAFSHVTQDYGSQQYYELAAKYYQFGAGWRDFSVSSTQVEWNLGGMSPMFILGAQKAQNFNDNLRTASRYTSVILLNHIVSAFDGYITVRLKNFEMSKNSQNSGQIVTGVSVGIPF
ncbi:hypothetical protein EP331_08410 [bacterium]|nr:MAG: hypothetical protein EP331_08410 [bacterium]